MSRFFRLVHRHYSRRINFRENWRGHLWQERFHSFVMDEAYLQATVRYTELNPVRAKLCAGPFDWPWSSARAHLQGQDDSVVTVKPMLERVSRWADYLSVKENTTDLRTIRQHAGTGRPVGSKIFIDRLEARTGKILRKGKPGPKPRIK